MALCQVQNHASRMEPLILVSTPTSTYSSLMAAVNRMTRDIDEERASRLATEAVDLANAGQLEVRKLLGLVGAQTLLTSLIRKHHANFERQRL